MAREPGGSRRAGIVIMVCGHRVHTTRQGVGRPAKVRGSTVRPTRSGKWMPPPIIRGGRSAPRAAAVPSRSIATTAKDCAMCVLCGYLLYGHSAGVEEPTLLGYDPPSCVLWSTVTNHATTLDRQPVRSRYRPDSRRHCPPVSTGIRRCPSVLSVSQTPPDYRYRIFTKQRSSMSALSPAGSDSLRPPGQN